MKRQQSGEELVKEKLNEIVAPSTAGLWQQMKNLLDEQLPVQKGRSALQECFRHHQENKIDSAQESGKDPRPCQSATGGFLPFFN
jgi:hypothetical protein